MKNLLILPLLILTICITSCKQKEPLKKSIVLKEPSLVIGDPFNYGIDDITLFPVGSNYTPEIIERNGFADELMRLSSGTMTLNFSACAVADQNDSYAESEFVNPNENVYDIRNILFRNLTNGNTYTLTEDTVHIISFALHKEFKKPLIFYRVVKQDYNSDSVYNNEDAIQLYTSDLRGKNFTQITPNNESFEKYELYLKSNTMLVKTRINNNKDSIFDHQDETNFREVSLSNPTMGIEIFSIGLRDSLRNMILPQKATVE